MFMSYPEVSYIPRLERKTKKEMKKSDVKYFIFGFLRR